jgi:hypothetical protein
VPTPVYLKQTVNVYWMFWHFQQSNEVNSFACCEQTRMRVVIGRAIAVPKVEKPSHALIEQYLQRFIASMADLYDRHCEAAGCQDRKLEIL